ncbi:MalY/PatB family protein [Enterococcus sp.]|uniref:MalY/PatB family protein n=1 Tax=Enterococcus sp. TaxID=35783 RepID=UPI002FCA08CF
MSQFDVIHNRLNTNSVKWDSLVSTYGKEDLLPFWVADMDFQASPAISKALNDYIKQGIYGYTLIPDSLYDAIITWQKKQHHYELTKEEILFSPGVVPSLVTIIQALTNPGDALLIHDPVYHPFTDVIQNTERQLILSNLIEEESLFKMDFDDMEEKIIKHQVKLFILCNPHNPGGRVWTREELQRLGKLCQKHQVLVISDEIHQDLVFEPNTFSSFQTIAPNFKDFSIVVTSATKTFNLAGIKNSMIFVKNPLLRDKIQAIQAINYQAEINTFGLIATEAAYNEGKEWLDELLVYLKNNIDFTCDFLKAKLPQIKIMKPQGTYLIWLDFSTYNLSDEALMAKLVDDAGVVVNPGISFGSKGTQHIRFNTACPRALLVEGLEKIALAFR